MNVYKIHINMYNMHIYRFIKYGRVVEVCVENACLMMLYHTILYYPHQPQTACIYMCLCVDVYVSGIFMCLCVYVYVSGSKLSCCRRPETSETRGHRKVLMPDDDEIYLYLVGRRKKGWPACCMTEEEAIGTCVDKDALRACMESSPRYVDKDA